ncbi:MAG: alpha/beta hydrolase [Burkholderiales bacterium]|nr:alpha/beta hydrolase [Burkholderiales bacterium]
MGRGEPVIVVPGLGSGAWGTHRLRSMLGEAGFIVRDWGLGVNRGPGDNFDEWLDGLTENVADMRSQAGKKVSLIGWSLGGLFAREFAKRHPRQIKQVITLGTPLKDFDTGTHASGLFKLLNRGGEPVTPQMRRRLSESPSVPLTAIYSRNDGIVSWQSCILDAAKGVECIEVNEASHLGMCANREVISAVAQRLAKRL